MWAPANARSCHPLSSLISVIVSVPYWGESVTPRRYWPGFPHPAHPSEDASRASELRCVFSSWRWASAESIILVRRLLPGAGPAEWVRRGNLPPSPQTILWVGSLRPSTNGSKRVWYLKHPRPLGGGSGGGGKNLFTGTHQNIIKIRHELSIVYISANTLLWKYKELMQQEIMKVAFVPMN